MAEQTPPSACAMENLETQSAIANAKTATILRCSKLQSSAPKIVYVINLSKYSPIACHFSCKTC